MENYHLQELSSSCLMLQCCLSANCLLQCSDLQFWLRHSKNTMFHTTLTPGEHAIIILTRWEPSLTSCTCCTCGSATTLVSWSEVMSCLLFGCSERTLLVTFVSCGNRKTKDSVSGCWNSREPAATPDTLPWFRPKAKELPHNTVGIMHPEKTEDEDKAILQIHSAPGHWLPWDYRWILATALGREIPLGKFLLILTLIIQTGFQTVTSSYHLADSTQ